MSIALAAAYVVDPELRAQCNEQGRNYWWAYISEINDRLGLNAEPVDVQSLPTRLQEFAVLIVGGTNQSLPRRELDAWVRAGGVLIGSACEGLDALFGVEPESKVLQTGGEFSISGEVRLRESPFTTDIGSPLLPNSSVLAASDIRLLRSTDCEVLAECREMPVITAREHGRGWAFYFGFDLGQTFWVIQQGRPVDRDWDGDGMWRTVDMVVTGGYPQDVPYTDEMLFILQNMVSVVPVPLVHQLPHEAGRIPDYVLYFSGDDEGLTDDQIPAAEFMASRGLPYHINCMAQDGKFGLDSGQICRLREIGTELSLHYNYFRGSGPFCEFEECDTRSQIEAFHEGFGVLPKCGVGHVIRWTGWTEPAVWMSEAGMIGDNSYAHVLSDVVNPINTVGFAFGTSYPFHFWSDHRDSNSRIEFLEMPFTGYEIGYVGDEDSFEMIDKCLILAEHYQSILSFMYHPIYIAQRPACRRAIDRLLARIKEMNSRVLFATPDGLIEWWKHRSAARVRDVELDDGRLSFRVSTSADIVVKVALGSRSSVRLDKPHRVVEKFGRRWLLVALDAGESRLEIDLR